MLAMRQVSVRVSGATLLDGVSLAVQPGEVLIVIGPNGAGKSTLLKALCGDIGATAGEVRMNGRLLRDWPLRERAKVRAVLPQETALGFPCGGESAHDRDIARAALQRVEADHFAWRRYTTLSGGERQRVQLARVLAQIWEPPADGSTRYLLLDEPTASLDLTHQHALLGLARRFAGHGVGVLAVLHDLNLAAAYADRIAVLKDGRLVALDAPAAVLQPALIKRVFAMTARVLAQPGSQRPLVVPVPVEMEPLP